MCPQPILRVRLALDEVAEGDAVELLATDPHTSLDIDVFCATTGHELMASQQEGEVWRFLLRKRRAAQ